MTEPAADVPEGTCKASPDGKAVAVRTGAGVAMPWGVMTTSNGGHYASHEEVADWLLLAVTP